MYIYDEIFGKEMVFYTFDDFMKHKNIIKDSFKTKDRQYRLMYKLYIEARPWVKECNRGDIWDYLNDYLNDESLQIQYDKYCKIYKKDVIVDE